MGIVEKELATFQLSDGTDCVVELTSKGEYHVHIGFFQLKFSEDEFHRFAQTVGDAHDELTQVKNINNE